MLFDFIKNSTRRLKNEYAQREIPEFSLMDQQFQPIKVKQANFMD